MNPTYIIIAIFVVVTIILTVQKTVNRSKKQNAVQNKPQRTENTNFKYAEPLKNTMLQEVHNEKMNGLEILGITEQNTPRKIVEAIYDYINIKEEAEGFSSMDTQEKDDISFAFGCLWGSAVIEQYGWRWTLLGDDEKSAIVCIVSPDERYCTCPTYLMKKIIGGNNIGPDGQNDNTTLLLFNIYENTEQVFEYKGYKYQSVH